MAAPSPIPRRLLRSGCSRSTVPDSHHRSTNAQLGDTIYQPTPATPTSEGTMRKIGWMVLLTSALAAPPLMGQAQSASSLSGVKAALDRYRDPIVAVHDGYMSSVGCVEFPAPGGAGQVPYVAGGMGVHFLNMSLIGPTIDSLHPQVLLYEPIGDTLHLVAAEWFVPTEASHNRPMLFGREFDGPMEGHHPIMPAALHHWDLHVWLWKDNPAGMFSPTNPALHCQPGPYSFKDKAPNLVKP